MAIVMNSVFCKAEEYRAAGQEEYAHDEDNAFRNFESIAEDLDLTREQVLLVYLLKHMDGIVAHFAKGTEEQREDIQGRIVDAIVYLTLLSGMKVDRDMPGWKGDSTFHEEKFREDLKDYFDLGLDHDIIGIGHGDEFIE